MYSRYRSKVSLEGRGGIKRYILLGVVSLFGVVIIFASGFYAGIKFQAKREIPSQKSQTISTRIDDSRSNIPEEKSKGEEIISKGEEKKTEIEGKGTDIPINTQKEGKEPRPKDKDLTFYDTLVSKKKQATVDLEKDKNSDMKKEPPNLNQGKVQGKSGNPNKIYTVQVGAYKEIDVAETVMNKLKKRGYSAYILAKEIPKEGKVYKVRIGEFPSRDRAEEQAKRIKSKEKMEAFVTLK